MKKQKSPEMIKLFFQGFQSLPGFLKRKILSANSCVWYFFPYSLYTVGKLISNYKYFKPKWQNSAEKANYIRILVLRGVKSFVQK